MELESEIQKFPLEVGIESPIILRLRGLRLTGYAIITPSGPVWNSPGGSEGQPNP